MNKLRPGADTFGLLQTSTVMNHDIIYIVGIVLVQLVLTFVLLDIKGKVQRMLHEVGIQNIMSSSVLPILVAKILSNFRSADESKEAQDIFTGQTAAEVVKQVTDALEAISLDKTKDVKIIISNDKINQEGFEVKLSYRLHDPV